MAMIAPFGNSPWMKGLFGIGLMGPSQGLGTVAKTAVAVGAGAVGAYLLTGQQHQDISQQATPTASGTTGYSFYQTPQGGPQNITLTNPKGATAEATQSATQLDTGGAMNVILIAVVAGVAFMLMRK